MRSLSLKPVTSKHISVVAVSGGREGGRESYLLVLPRLKFHYKDCFSNKDYATSVYYPGPGNLDSQPASHRPSQVSHTHKEVSILHMTSFVIFGFKEKCTLFFFLLLIAEREAGRGGGRRERA